MDSAEAPLSLELLDELRTSGSRLRRQLCVAVSSISSRIAQEQQRALAQVWLPGFTPEGLIALTCAGAPYAIAGEGDLCALFRCVSCRYIIYPTSPDPRRRGSIGRAFLSHRPEICSNISTAPVELYHRAHEARQCLLHSLCVMPIWMPEITRKAPVAVLEILQPETQPDFDSLHELTAQAFRSVQRCKVSVIAPMPDITAWGEPPAPFQNSAGDQPGPCPSTAPHVHGGPGTTVHEVAPTGAAACLHTSLPEGEERMEIVFNERAVAENSDEHMQVVAEKIAACHNNANGVTVSAGALQVGTLEGLGMQSGKLPEGPADAAASAADGIVGDGLGAGGGREGRGDADGDIMMDGADVAISGARGEHDGEHLPNMRSNGRPPQDTKKDRAATTVAVSEATPRAVHSKHPSGQMGETAGETERGAGRQPAAGRGREEGSQNGSLRSLTGAVALLKVVQQDKSWQAASRAGGSLKGGGAQLLAALHSSGATSAGPGGGPGAVAGGPGAGDYLVATAEHPGASGTGHAGDDRARKKRNSCQMHHQDMPPAAAEAPQPAPTAAAAAGPTTCTAERSATAPRQPPPGAAPGSMVTRSGFVYPGNKGATFVKVGGGHGGGQGQAQSHVHSSGMHADNHNSSTHLHTQHGQSLQDKVQLAEGGHLMAAAAATSATAGVPQRVAPPGHGHGHCTSAFTAQPPSQGQQHVAPRMPSLPNGHGPAEGAPQPHYDATHVYTPAVPPVAAPPEDVLQAAGSVSSPNGWGAAGPPGSGGAFVAAHAVTPAGTASAAGPPVGVRAVRSSASLATAAAGQAAGAAATAEEIKAMRNKVNRADGGIGRKLTLDVLQQHFGKGLKEAAESLGMCPTTLKRACRRLGVRRWPRTPEAASQVVAEALQHQQEQAVEAAQQNGSAAAEAGFEGGSWPQGVPVGEEGDPGVTLLPVMHAGPDPAAGVGGPQDSLLPGGSPHLVGMGHHAQVGEFDDFLNMLEVSE